MVWGRDSCEPMSGSWSVTEQILARLVIFNGGDVAQTVEEGTGCSHREVSDYIISSGIQP